MRRFVSATYFSALLVQSCLTGSPVAAQEAFSFETVNGFLMVRMRQDGENVAVEYLSPNTGLWLQCLALDANKQPIAIEEVQDEGYIEFDDLNVEVVSEVICRAKPGQE